jgi:hypothetical protein
VLFHWRMRQFAGLEAATRKNKWNLGALVDDSHVKGGLFSRQVLEGSILGGRGQGRQDNVCSLEDEISLFSNWMSLKHFCRLAHFINVSNICCISMKRSSFVKRVSKLTPKVLGCKGLPLTNALAYLISSSVTKEFFHKIALVQQIIEIVP